MLQFGTVRIVPSIAIRRGGNARWITAVRLEGIQVGFACC
jgi:hypothetical protein